MAKRKAAAQPDPLVRSTSGDVLPTIEQAKDVLSGAQGEFKPVNPSIDILDRLRSKQCRASPLWWNVNRSKADASPPVPNT